MFPINRMLNLVAPQKTWSMSDIPEELKDAKHGIKMGISADSCDNGKVMFPANSLDVKVTDFLVHRTVWKLIGMAPPSTTLATHQNILFLYKMTKSL